MFWRQRSRLVWLKEGDKNSRFFHLSTMKHRAANRISGIKKGRFFLRKIRILPKRLLGISLPSFLKRPIWVIRTNLIFLKPSLQWLMIVRIGPLWLSLIWRKSRRLFSLCLLRKPLAQMVFLLFSSRCNGKS